MEIWVYNPLISDFLSEILYNPLISDFLSEILNVHSWRGGGVDSYRFLKEYQYKIFPKHNRPFYKRQGCPKKKRLNRY